MCLKTRVFVFCKTGTIPKQRYRQVAEVWSGSETISKADWGVAGTWEGLLFPRGRTRTDGQPRDQTTGLCRDLAAPCHNDKNKQQAQVVSMPRETEGKEKGRGSLSNFIVLFESREIVNRRKPVIKEGRCRKLELRFRNINVTVT